MLATASGMLCCDGSFFAGAFSTTTTLQCSSFLVADSNLKGIPFGTIHYTSWGSHSLMTAATCEVLDCSFFVA